jgi:hypothetical protein
MFKSVNFLSLCRWEIQIVKYYILKTHSVFYDYLIAIHRDVILQPSYVSSISAVTKKEKTEELYHPRYNAV